MQTYHAFEGPWRILPWPASSTVTLHGRAGIGASSIAALLRPAVWITLDQSLNGARDLLQRIHPQPATRIFTAKTAEDILQILEQVTVGPLVVDAITALDPTDAERAFWALDQWAKKNQAHVCLVLQSKLDGQVHRHLPILHLAEANIQLSSGSGDLRTFRVVRSRWSDEQAVSWKMDACGRPILLSGDAHAH